MAGVGSSLNRHVCCQVYIAEHPGRDSREALPAVTLRLQPPKLMFALRTNECVPICPPSLHLAHL